MILDVRIVSSYKYIFAEVIMYIDPLCALPWSCIVCNIIFMNYWYIFLHCSKMKGSYETKGSLKLSHQAFGIERNQIGNAGIWVYFPSKT